LLLLLSPAIASSSIEDVSIFAVLPLVYLGHIMAFEQPWLDQGRAVYPLRLEICRPRYKLMAVLFAG
jgi:hypothetical protein